MARKQKSDVDFLFSVNQKRGKETKSPNAHIEIILKYYHSNNSLIKLAKHLENGLKFCIFAPRLANREKVWNQMNQINR